MGWWAGVGKFVFSLFVCCIERPISCDVSYRLSKLNLYLGLSWIISNFKRRRLLPPPNPAFQTTDIQRLDDMK